MAYNLTTSNQGAVTVDQFDSSRDAAVIMENRLAMPEWEAADIYLQKTSIQGPIYTDKMKGQVRRLKLGEFIRVTKSTDTWFQVERLP